LAGVPAPVCWLRMRPTAEQLAASLGLRRHPEGGYYLETYRSAETVGTPRGERPATTAIIFLVTADSASRLHRLSSDELWIFQGGLPLELVTISPAGELERRLLGDAAENVTGGSQDERAASAGLLLQALEPAGSWQGARVAGGPHPPADRAWTLVSCVVTPGFEFADFELGEPDALLAAYPQHAGIIAGLT
jgi:predicted cupin superfamily sugar epimerase